MSLTQASAPIQISTTPTDTLTILTETSTTTPIALPIPSPCNTLSQHPTTTRREKRPNNREKIVDNLEKREAERNKMMKALLIEETEDDVDLFFKSLAKSVKKLTPVLQQRAKAETLNVITNLETEMWKPIQYSSFNPSNNQNFCSDAPATVSHQLLSPCADADSSHQSSTLTELTSFSQHSESFCHRLQDEDFI